MWTLAVVYYKYLQQYKQILGGAIMSSQVD